MARAFRRSNTCDRAARWRRWHAVRFFSRASPASARRLATTAGPCGHSCRHEDRHARPSTNAARACENAAARKRAAAPPRRTSRTAHRPLVRCLGDIGAFPPPPRCRGALEASDWPQIRFRLASDWPRAGLRLASDWPQAGLRLASRHGRTRSRRTNERTNERACERTAARGRRSSSLLLVEAEALLVRAEARRHVRLVDAKVGERVLRRAADGPPTGRAARRGARAAASDERREDERAGTTRNNQEHPHQTTNETSRAGGKGRRTANHRAARPASPPPPPPLPSSLPKIRAPCPARPRPTRLSRPSRAALPSRRCPDRTPQRSAAQRSAAQRSAAQRSAAQRSAAQRKGQRSAVRSSAAQRSVPCGGPSGARACCARGTRPSARALPAGAACRRTWGQAALHDIRHYIALHNMT